MLPGRPSNVRTLNASDALAITAWERVHDVIAMCKVSAGPLVDNCRTSWADGGGRVAPRPPSIPGVGARVSSVPVCIHSEEVNSRGIFPAGTLHKNRKATSGFGGSARGYSQPLLFLEVDRGRMVMTSRPGEIHNSLTASSSGCRVVTHPCNRARRRRAWNQETVLLQISVFLPQCPRWCTHRNGGHTVMPRSVQTNS